MKVSWECVFYKKTQLKYSITEKNASSNLKNKKPRGFISRKPIKIILFKNFVKQSHYKLRSSKEFGQAGSIF